MNLILNLSARDFYRQRFGQAPLRFTWDSETGAVSGIDAERVRQLAANYAGKTYGVPHRLQPETYLVKDPLRDPVEMAALLGVEWELPPELEALYPKIHDDTPKGAVN
jgi:hypothetical protein